MNKTELLQHTEKQISSCETIIAKNDKQIFASSVIRFLSFLAIIVLVFYRNELSSVQFVVSEIIVVLVFVVSVRYRISLNKKHKFYTELKRINQDRIASINEDYSKFHGGKEFANSEHDYTNDIDIFGEKSIFQMINRTVTLGGKICLAKKFMNIQTDIFKLEKHKKAIEELSNMVSFRDKISALSAVISSKKEAQNRETNNVIFDELMSWVFSKSIVKSNKFLTLLIYIIPAITLTALVLWGFGIVGSFMVIIGVILQLFILGIFTGKVNIAHENLSQKSKILHKYETLIKEIIGCEFSAEYLKEKQNNLTVDNISAEQQLKKVRVLLKAFDIRFNFLLSLVFNSLLMWDLYVLLRLEKLKNNLKIILPNMFDTLSEFDALMSLSEFAYINPSYTYPEFKSGDFYLETKNIMHPLLPSSSRVGNDFFAKDNPKVFIITGANMSGKSTFLRTVAVNAILASTGTKVCADLFVFTPVKIYTSMRNSDSLQEHESYFYAELVRLKNMITRLKNGEKLFLILDEILRGTNSKDKHLGSKALIEQLLAYNAFCFIATHDIQLGALENKHQAKVFNRRFEAEIINSELYFDYKIKEGISENLNAVFLMEKYGIISK